MNLNLWKNGFVKYFAGAKYEMRVDTRVKFSALQKVKWNPPTAAAISHAEGGYHTAERYFPHPQGWIILKKSTCEKQVLFFLAERAGFEPARRF